MVPGLKNLPYEERLREIMDRGRQNADLIKVFKIVKGLSSIRLETFFQLDNSGITRGHQWKRKKRRYNTDLRQHFFLKE